MLEKLRKSPTIIALALTAFTYWMAYTFQSSYLRYFGVGAYEIDVSINNLVIALVTLIAVLLALDMLADVYRNLLEKVDTNKPMHRYVRRLVRSAVALLLVLAYLYSLEMPSFIIEVIIFGAVFVLFAAEPLFYREKKMGFSKAVEKMYEKKEAIVVRPKKYVSYTDRFQEYIIGGFFLMIVASVSGYLYAQMVPSLYLISSDGPIKQLLVLKNGDTIVTRNYNVDTGSFEPGYTVKKVQDQLTLNEKTPIKRRG